MENPSSQRCHLAEELSYKLLERTYRMLDALWLFRVAWWWAERKVWRAGSKQRPPSSRTVS